MSIHKFETRRTCNFPIPIDGAIIFDIRASWLSGLERCIKYEWELWEVMKWVMRGNEMGVIYRGLQINFSYISSTFMHILFQSFYFLFEQKQPWNFNCVSIQPFYCLPSKIWTENSHVPSTWQFCQGILVISSHPLLPRKNIALGTHFYSSIAISSPLLSE